MTRQPGGPATPLARDERGSVVTVGTFDGVHRGHQAVLGALVRRGREAGRRTVLVTFHPHPLRVVRPDAAPPLLTSTPEKKLLLACTGVHYALFLEFTPALQQLSARRFVEEILLAGLGMRELVIGHDHGFGRGREGSVDTMRALGAELGFGVSVIEPVRLGGDPISSSRVRRALETGDLAEAARCLGRHYSLAGVVVHGEHRGRELGFPTANLHPDDPDKLLPAPGIYLAYGRFRGECVPGLLHLGPRPTFPGYPPSIELYLFDWSGDVYGERMEIEIRQRIRDVRPFAGADALIEQMRMDEAEGRALLQREPPGSGCVAPS